MLAHAARAASSLVKHLFRESGSVGAGRSRTAKSRPGDRLGTCACATLRVAPEVHG